MFVKWFFFFTVMGQEVLNLPLEYVPHRFTGVRACSCNFSLSECVCMWFVRQTKQDVVKHRLNVCASFFVIFISWKLIQDWLVWYRWRTWQSTDCQIHKCLSLVSLLLLAGEGVVIYFKYSVFNLAYCLHRACLPACLTVCNNLRIAFIPQPLKLYIWNLT